MEGPPSPLPSLDIHRAVDDDDGDDDDNDGDGYNCLGADDADDNDVTPPPTMGVAKLLARADPAVRRLPVAANKRIAGVNDLTKEESIMDWVSRRKRMDFIVIMVDFPSKK